MDSDPAGTIVELPTQSPTVNQDVEGGRVQAGSLAKRRNLFTNTLDLDERRNIFLVKLLLFSVCFLWWGLFIVGEVYEVDVPSSKDGTGSESVTLNETYNYTYFVLGTAQYIGWLSFMIQSMLATDNVKFESPEQEEVKRTWKEKLGKHVLSYQIDPFMVSTAVISGLSSALAIGRQNAFPTPISFLLVIPFLFVVLPLLLRMLLVIRRRTFLNYSKNNGGVKSRIYLNCVILIPVLFIFIMACTYISARSFRSWGPFKPKHFPDILTKPVANPAWQQVAQEGFIEGQAYSLISIQAILGVLAVMVPADIGWLDRRMPLTRSLAFTVLFVTTVFVIMFLLGLGNRGKRTVEAMQYGVIVWNCLFGLMGVFMVFPLLLSRLAKLTATSAAQENFDVFLTHDWGKDEKGRNNHSRVAEVNKALKSLGFKTWFDEQRLTGNIQEQMASGIENSTVVVVFITKRYIDKVGMIPSPQNPHPNPNDNCKREFLHAVNNKTARLMIPVVMESRVKNSSKWEGPVGFNLGSELYVDLINNDTVDEQVSELGKLIEDKISAQKPDTTHPGHQGRKGL